MSRVRPTHEHPDEDAEALRAGLLGEGDAALLAETIKALGDPTRLRLVSGLLRGERCVSELAAALEMSISAISHQLSLMRRLRLVRARREGRHIYYALDDDHVEQLYQLSLDHLRHA
ncbi:MAG: metalloregulator ArsR/SmtB family transcription factor [Chloroflexota bacterium]